MRVMDAFSGIFRSEGLGGGAGGGPVGADVVDLRELVSSVGTSFDLGFFRLVNLRKADFALMNLRCGLFPS